MNLAERRPSLKIHPDQFPYSDDPTNAALDYAERHNLDIDKDVDVVAGMTMNDLRRMLAGGS